MDTDYFLDEETIQNGSLMLLGLAGLSSLEYDQTSRNWIIWSLKGPRNQAKAFLNECIIVPLGFKSLYFKGSENTKFDVKISKASCLNL